MKRFSLSLFRVSHKKLRVVAAIGLMISATGLLFQSQFTQAAQVTIDASLSTTTGKYRSSLPRIVFTTDQVGYIFYSSSTANCIYKKTSDGGATWAAAVIVDAQTDCIDVSVWYDRWTPGDTTGNYIYITTYDSGADDVFYNRLDVSSDTLQNGTAPVAITSAPGPAKSNVFTNAYSRPAVVKATDGVLFVGMHDVTVVAQTSFIIKCSTTCSTASNWSDAGTLPLDNDDNDQLIMMPLASGNILAVRFEDTNDSFESKVWNGTSWDAAWITIATNRDNNGTYPAKMSLTVNKINGDVYFVYIGEIGTIGSNDDIETAVYSGGAWAIRTDVITNSCSGTPPCDNRGVTSAKISFNENNGDIYVVYSARTTPATVNTANVYWKKSTDSMHTWGAEQVLVDPATLDTHGPAVDIMSSERFFVAWDDILTDDMLGDTMADLTVPTFEQSGYRIFNNYANNPWWNTSWLSRRKITFDNKNVPDNLTNFPVRVSLTSGNIDYAKTQNAGQDIRFVDGDGTLLKHEIETWNEAGTSEVWVRVPQIDLGSTTDYIHMYYDNAGASDAQDAPNVWSNGYQMVQHMDATGACPVTHTDSTSNGNDGACGGNSVTATTGKVNGGQDIGGTDDYIAVPNDATLNITGDITVQAWMKPDALTGVAQEGVAKALTTANADRQYLMGVAGTDRWRGIVFIGGSQFGATGTSAPSTSAFTLLSMTRTGTEFKMFENATQSGGTQVISGSLNTSTGDLRMGVMGSTLTGDFAGDIDEVRIANVGRTPGWVAADYLSMNNTYNTFGSEQAYNALHTVAVLAHAANNTGAVAVPPATPFRLRYLMHIGGDGIQPNHTAFKLQYAPNTGTCDTSFSGETYGDVGSSGAVQYFDNSTDSDGATINTISGDPTHSSDTKVLQTYEESNNFTALKRIGGGEDGLWDFSLIDTTRTAGASYCFRVVKSDASTLNTYSVIPEMQQASLTNIMRHGNFFLNETEQSDSW